MSELAAGGAGIVMISSELLELLGLCSRILVMYAGRTCAEVDGTSATEERIMFAATGNEMETHP